MASRKSFKILSFLSIPLLFLLLTSCSNTSNEVKVEERTLNIYALNDFHGAFLFDEKNEQAGLSRIGQFLINEKENNPQNTIVLSSGDMFQGGAESNITYGEIVIEAMNTIGFDSMTIGNHEFDWGEEKLKEMAGKMEFPLLGINVFYENDGENTNIRPSYLAPSTIVDFDGLDVGIIGSIMSSIDDSIIATIADDFYFAYSQNLIIDEANRLRNEENCDIVILSSHDGSYRLYEDLSEYVDAIFLGHEHEKLEGKYENGVPYVEGLNYGTYLSHISLDLKLNSNNRYDVVSSTVENINCFETFTEESNDVDEIYNKYKSGIEEIRDEVLYTFDSSVSKSRFGRFIAYSLLNYVNQKMDVGFISSMGAINSGGGVRDNVSEGAFTYGDLIRVYPFENTLSILKVTPEIYEKSYVSQTGLYKVFENDNNEPVINEDGFCYIATIDYVAYKSTYPKEDIIDYSSISCRDIVANTLKTEGFIFVS